MLPLDDRFRERFVVNANRFHGARKRYVFHAGMGNLPTDVAPDVRSRSYLPFVLYRFMLAALVFAVLAARG